MYKIELSETILLKAIATTLSSRKPHGERGTVAADRPLWPDTGLGEQSQ